jgi:hypothetical protein
MFPKLRSFSLSSSSGSLSGNRVYFTYYISSLSYLLRLEINSIRLFIVNVHFSSFPCLSEVIFERSTFHELDFCGRNLQSVILREISIENNKIDISCSLKRFHLYVERTKGIVGKDPRIPISLIGKGNEIESFYCNLPQKIILNQLNE